MPRHLVALSGNVAVGKSTIGPYVAEQLGAEWLSESEISSQFAHLFGDETRQSRLIAQIAFTSLRQATILSKFLSGIELIVSERSLWDSWIYYEMWRERFDFRLEENFFRELHEQLEKHPLSYTISTVWLQARLDVLSRRIRLRNEPFDHVHTDMLIRELGDRYEMAFRQRPPTFAVDVSDLENSTKALRDIAQVICHNLPKLN